MLLQERHGLGGLLIQREDGQGDACRRVLLNVGDASVAQAAFDLNRDQASATRALRCSERYVPASVICARNSP